MAGSNVNQDWNAVIASAQAQIREIDAQLAQLEAAAEAKSAAAEKAARDAYNAIRAKQDAELKVISDQIQSINPQIFALRDQAGNVTPTFSQVNDARIAAEADPNNAALRATYESLRSQRSAALAPINSKIDSLEQQRTALATKRNQIESTYAPQLQAAQQQLAAAINLASAEVKKAIELDDKKGQLQEQINEAERQLMLQRDGTTAGTTNTTSATTVPASAQPGNPNTATTVNPSGPGTSTPATTTSPSNTTTTTTGSGTSSPATTTNPSNALPLGDQIDDIYDPNLTPEQIASLSPGDQKARADMLGYAYTGPDVTLGEVDPETGDITVTAPGEDEELDSIATQQDQIAFSGKKDWRVRLSLSPEANYLYRAPNPGILSPLAPEPKGTDGVIFPYTPTISVSYAANYEASNIIHNNYKVYQYSNSSVDQVTITCDFTAQDTYEADYLLAVIHFFRSMTKMFYGLDQFPRRGTPPPLCYMFGMGNYQFAAHPLAITSFSYNLPNDVDYIKTVNTFFSGTQQEPAAVSESEARLANTGAAPGGNFPKPDLAAQQNESELGTATWVPTKIQLSITCVPIMSRNLVSNRFSLEEYSNGTLLNGIDKNGGGFW